MDKTSGGVGLCELLGVVFIVLKLCGVIDWSWWLVTVPIWLPFAVLVPVAMTLIAVSTMRFTLGGLNEKPSKPKGPFEY